MADYTQGNLSLAVQTLTNLQYICGNSQVTKEDVSLCISDKSQYQVYELVDSILSGNTNLAVKMLDRLKNIKQDAGHIINSLLIEVNKLSQVINTLDKYNFTQLCKQHGVYKMKQAVFKDALDRHSVKSINQTLQLLDIADQVLKGWLSIDIWYVIKEIIFSCTDAGHSSPVLENKEGLT